MTKRSFENRSAIPSERLPDQFYRGLHFAWLESPRNVAERGVPKPGIGIGEPWMVECIERLASYLEFEEVAERKILLQREVPIVGARAPEVGEISFCCAVGEIRRLHEGGGIETHNSLR